MEILSDGRHREFPIVVRYLDCDPSSRPVQWCLLPALYDLRVGTSDREPCEFLLLVDLYLIVDGSNSPQLSTRFSVKVAGC